MSIERHEASHAAAAIWLRRRVAYIEKMPGFIFPGEVAGACRSPIDGDVEPDQLAIAIVGYLADGKDGWPPPWAEAQETELEELAKVIRLTGIGQEGYETAISLCREMMANPYWIELRNAIERALYVVPRLEEEDIAALCRAVDVPVPVFEPEGAAT